MSPAALLRLLTLPRYIVERGALDQEAMHRLANSRPGDVIQVPSGSTRIIPLPDHRQIHLHFGPQKPRRTASMGQGIRRRK